ncbi:MAG: FAD:protein FMN transferase [Planctomycetota bacterium]|nr:MAG: FAD:protein FMN transferase [Planctomycetota bacterium]
MTTRDLLLAGVALGATWSALASAQAGESGATPQRFERAEVHMGTPFRLVFYADTETLANKAATAAFSRVAELNGSLSDYLPESELSRLGAASPTPEPLAVGDDLWRVLRHAQRLARATDGAFDVTVGPYSRLWRRARRRRAVPESELLEQAAAAVGYEKLRLHECRQSVSLLAERMRLDLGGIAKGYAADEALAVLRKHGITAALVDAGGDVVAGAPPPGRATWHVAIAEVVEADEEQATPTPQLLLEDAAVATSGDLYQYLEVDGRRYSHIIDPRTGLGLPGPSSVTVIAPDGITADSLASAVSVLGAERGLELVRQTPRAACRFVWIDEEDRTQARATDNFAQYLQQTTTTIAK